VAASAPGPATGVSFLHLADLLDLFRLALPVMATRTSFLLMGLTDAIVLGRSTPGELPFVLNAWLPLGVALGFGLGLPAGVQGVASMAARALGAGWAPIGIYGACYVAVMVPLCWYLALPHRGHPCTRVRKSKQHRE